MIAPKLLLAWNLAVGWASGTGGGLIRAQWNVGDIDHADFVVMGRIANYGLILDPVIRERNREMAARRGDTKIGEPESNASTFITDYAQFDIIVDKVLRGM